MKFFLLLWLVALAASTDEEAPVMPECKDAPHASICWGKVSLTSDDPGFCDLHGVHVNIGPDTCTRLQQLYGIVTRDVHPFWHRHTYEHVRDTLDLYEQIRRIEKEE